MSPLRACFWAGSSHWSCAHCQWPLSRCLSPDALLSLIWGVQVKGPVVAQVLRTELRLGLQTLVSESDLIYWICSHSPYPAMSTLLSVKFQSLYGSFSVLPGGFNTPIEIDACLHWLHGRGSTTLNNREGRCPLGFFFSLQIVMDVLGPDFMKYFRTSLS